MAEDRISVLMEDGALLFLQGEAIQRYKDGTLNQMTPEREKRLAEIERDLMLMEQGFDLRDLLEKEEEELRQLEVKLHMKTEEQALKRL